MQIKDVDKLKAWLLKKLEPLCDADPAALAKYVVALLRKEKPKAALRGLCIDQLEVFLAKETTAFVEKLFRCLESESYLKGEDPPPPSPPTPTHPATAPPSRLSSLPSPSPGIPRSDGIDRRQSEDRHKEVDDDDRDFRRSRRHDSDMSGGGGGGGAVRKITAPISGGGAGGRIISLNKKRSLQDPAGVTSSSKRRVVMDHSRTAESDGHHRSGGVSSSTGPGSGRRPVRERLGPRTDESRSERLKRGRSGRSSRSSSGSGSSSSSDESSSSSDSDSSTSRKERGGDRKKRKVAVNPPAAVGVAKGGSVEVKRRQRCKDYDKKGFCILGESCPYDHGLDPLVIDGAIHPYVHHHPPPHPHPPPPGMPGMGGVPTLPPPPPPELMAIPPGRHSPPNSKSESYNPEEPGLSSTTSSGMIPTHIAPPHPIPLRPMFPPPPHMPGLMPPHIPGFPPHPHHPFGPSPMMGPPMPHHIRPRPHYSGGSGGPKPHLKPSDTLIVRKIPKELNTITKLSGHFEKFGTIVNLTVRYEGDLEGALVQFSSPTEAKKAHDNTEAVFNNRFIRIYYLRKDEMLPPAPLKEFSLEAPVSVAVSRIHPTSSPTTPPPPHSSSSSAAASIATVTSSETLPPVQPTPDSSGGGAEPEPALIRQQRDVLDHPKHNPLRRVEDVPPPPTSSHHDTTAPSRPTHPHPHPRPPPTQQRRRSSEAAKKSFELQKKTQELLQKKIEQQKLLIGKLEKAGKHLSAEEKNKIKKNLKTLSGSITKLTEVANKTVLSQKQEKQQPPHLHGQQPQQGGLQDKRQGAKMAGEPLKADKQQAVLHKAALKERAESLRKEAHKLGLLSSPSQPLPTSTTAATTAATAPTTAAAVGKGRGRPDLRNKLHGKPRQLLVIGVKERDKLTNYFESFGGLDGVEVDPSNSNNLIFTFRNNASATQVVNAASTFGGKPLIMKWYTPKPRLPSQSTPATLPTLSSSSKASLPHQHSTDTRRSSTPTRGSVARQESESGAIPTTPTLTKLDPQELHLVEDSDDEEEGRAWRR